MKLTSSLVTIDPAISAALSAADKRLAAAEANYPLALSELAEARQAKADLDRRLRQGAASVSTEQLQLATLAAERAKTLHDAAKRNLATAERAASRRPAVGYGEGLALALNEYLYPIPTVITADRGFTPEAAPALVIEVPSREPDGDVFRIRLALHRTSPIERHPEWEHIAAALRDAGWQAIEEVRHLATGDDGSEVEHLTLRVDRGVPAIPEAERFAVGEVIRSFSRLVTLDELTLTTAQAVVLDMTEVEGVTRTRFGVRISAHMAASLPPKYASRSGVDAKAEAPRANPETVAELTAALSAASGSIGGVIPEGRIVEWREVSKPRWSTKLPAKAGAPLRHEMVGWETPGGTAWFPITHIFGELETVSSSR